MNVSLSISMERVDLFWSRSRKELWLKEIISGNYQRILSIAADCDGMLLVRVLPEALPLQGNTSCFERELYHKAFLIDSNFLTRD